jgi:uncharacterized protein YegP (UPF0339 family)
VARGVRIELYQDRRGEHRFRFVGGNGRVMPDGYKRRDGLIKALRTLADAYRNAQNLGCPLGLPVHVPIPKRKKVSHQP